MKKLFFFLFFLLSIVAIAQNNVNLKEYNCYKIVTNGVANVNISKIIGNCEKSEKADFACFDKNSMSIFFILNKYQQINELIDFVNNAENIKLNNAIDINLTEEMFFDLYLKRSDSFNNEKIPEDIVLGNKSNSDKFFQIVKQYWYKTKIDNNIKNNSTNINLPPHYPVFRDTGNPEYDKTFYETQKQEWIKNYPNEVEQVTGRSYKNSTGIDNPQIIKQ